MRLAGLATVDRAAVPHKAFNPYVQGARGLFAMTVFVYHVVNSNLPTFGLLDHGWLNDCLRASEYGVELFFCVSGFAITMSLGSRRSLRLFMWDRAIRIFPVLWASIGVMTLLGLMFHKTPDDISAATLLAVLPANLIALPGIFPIQLIHPAAWSLSYEMVFYSLAALVVGISRHADAGTRDTGIWDAGTWTAVVLGLLGVVFYPRAMFFICGVVAVRWAWLRTLPVWLVVPEIWLVAFLACWRCIQIASPRQMMNYTLLAWVGDVRLVLAIGALVFATLGFSGLVRGTGLTGVVLRQPIAQYLGKISYSLYLWHPLIMAVTKRFLQMVRIEDHAGVFSQAVFFCLTLPPSLATAAISHKYLEKRAGQWLHAQLLRWPSVGGLPSVVSSSGRFVYQTPEANKPIRPRANS